MAKHLTIDDLYKILADEKKKGNGKKKIMISTDDEGNGYHCLWFGVTPINDDFSYAFFHGISFEDAKKDCVILG